MDLTVPESPDNEATSSESGTDKEVPQMPASNSNIDKTTSKKNETGSCPGTDGNTAQTPVNMSNTDEAATDIINDIGERESFKHPLTHESLNHNTEILPVGCSISNSDQPPIISVTNDLPNQCQDFVGHIQNTCQGSQFEEVDLDPKELSEDAVQDVRLCTSDDRTVTSDESDIGLSMQDHLSSGAQTVQNIESDSVDSSHHSSKVVCVDGDRAFNLEREKVAVDKSHSVCSQIKQPNFISESAKSHSTSTTPTHLTQVLTIAEDRLSLQSFESDCASSSDPVEPGTLGSSRCTTSDDDEDDDDAWISSIVADNLRKPTRGLQSKTDALQQTIAYLSKKASNLEKQLASQEAEFQEALARARAQSKAQIDKLKSQVESATKDKETMVVRYAQSEREVINSKKAKEVTDKKIRDLLTERDSLLGKVKVLHADRVRACSSLDSKMAELAHCQREVDKLKEELMNRDIKIKWAQNKLKEESDMHKETLCKLDQTIQRLRETREESEQVRRDCQDMIRRYQEAEEIKSVSLDQQLKVKLSELEVQKQERSDQEEVYLAMRRELEALKKRDRTSLEENQGLTVKIQTLERERLEHEQTVSKLKESLNKLRQDAVDLNGKLAETENLELQLEREREKVSASQREVERLRAAHQDLQNDLEACHTKEGELLEFTQRLTTKTVHLQSEHTLLEVKAQNLDQEVSRLTRQCAELETAKKDLSQELSEERRLRQEETQLLARKLAEKTKTVEALNLKLEEAENEARVLKRRHITSIKELSRELGHAKKRLEQMSSTTGGDASASVFNNHHTPVSSNTPGESLSLQSSSRTSSSASLVEMNNSLHTVNMAGSNHQEQPQQNQSIQTVNSHHPPPTVTFSNRRTSKLKTEHSSYSGKHRTKTRESVSGNQAPATASNQSGANVPEIEQQVLIDRIVRLQKTLARRNEKVDFLEEHVQQLLADIKKKSKVIQNYILREEAGALASSTMDQNKAEILRRGGIMASVYGSHSTDSSMTLDLSLEINRKLQAVLEDTLLKNITLKENINTLGHEIARISREQKKCVT